MPAHPFDRLLAKPLTRREFLLHIGLLLVAVTGIAGLLRTISDPDLLNRHKKVSSGFGSGSYGGVRQG